MGEIVKKGSIPHIIQKEVGQKRTARLTFFSGKDKISYTIEVYEPPEGTSVATRTEGGRVLVLLCPTLDIRMYFEEEGWDEKAVLRDFGQIVMERFFLTIIGNQDYTNMFGQSIAQIFSDKVSSFEV